MPDPKLRITIERVLFTYLGKTSVGSGDGYFEAAVNDGTTRTEFGVRPAESFDYRHHPRIELGWSTEVNVRNVDQVEVSLVCKDRADDSRIGSFAYRLTWPWRQFEQEILTVAHGTFAMPIMHMMWSVRLIGQQRTAAPPEAVVPRAYNGSVRYGTVSGTREFRLEICPVRPVPADARLPRRPVHIRTATNVVRNGSPRLFSATDPMNFLANPATIPILDAPPTGDAAAAVADATNEQKDEATYANPRNAARIEYTYYWPDTERFTDNDRRLQWRKIDAESTGDIAFLKRNPGDPDGSESQGLKVLVYGVGDTEGDVVLGVYFRNKLVTKYRALVCTLKRIPCRFNILNARDDADSCPISTPDHVAMHRHFANRFLRQVGVMLTLDSNTTRYYIGGGRNITSTDHRGIFRVRCPDQNDTRGLSNARAKRSVLFNHRRGVLNFIYVHSKASGATGAALGWPESKLGARADLPDNGSPSGSWILPSGVSPDDPTGQVEIKFTQGYPLPAPNANVYGMMVTNARGPAPGGADARAYGKTITHELGHMLNLGHRVEKITNNALNWQWWTGALVPAGGGGIAQLVHGNGNLLAGPTDGLWCDELWHPRHQNVMNFAGDPYLGHDLDILQAKIVRQSRILDLAP